MKGWHAALDARRSCIVLRMLCRRTFAQLLLVSWGLAACRAQAVAIEKTSELPLWPGDAPGSAGLALAEVVTERSKDPALHDRAITGILRPSLTVYVPAQPNGAALIVAPGGSYLREAWDKEGVDTARWFANKGVTVFLLKYRLPAEGHQARSDVPLQDAQRAVRVVRARAASFRLDAKRIGVMGFSAGGHLAALLASRFDEKVYEPVDAADRLSARPDFAILLYPVVSMEDPIAHAGSRRALLGESPNAALLVAKSADRQVTRENPRTLLLLAADDQAVLPENSLRYYRALRDAGVSAELHVYESGGHGFGMRSPKGAAAEGWAELALSWMRRRHS
ncbi:MAG TPA: alpha/beta hydrolase [Polyangiaceae bacterium]|nr:alpha/beta hydrolase [Polyangiaceae bacterium]